jgi:hypothetical protein
MQKITFVVGTELKEMDATLSGAISNEFAHLILRQYRAPVGALRRRKKNSHELSRAAIANFI